MAVFILLALALAVMTIGAVAVAVRELLRVTRRLQAAAQASRERLEPLLTELQSETAVSGTEVEAIGERLAAWQEERRRPGGRALEARGGTGVPEAGPAVLR